MTTRCWMWFSRMGGIVFQAVFQFISNECGVPCGNVSTSNVVFRLEFFPGGILSTMNSRWHFFPGGLLSPKQWMLYSRWQRKIRRQHITHTLHPNGCTIFSITLENNANILRNSHKKGAVHIWVIIFGLCPDSRSSPFGSASKGKVQFLTQRLKSIQALIILIELLHRIHWKNYMFLMI